MVFGRAEGREEEGFTLAIIRFHSGHKAAATPDLARGSICLILGTGKKNKPIASYELECRFLSLQCFSSGLQRTLLRRGRDKEALTPLVADQHWTSCVSGAVVSLPAGKQVVPEHSGALEHTHTLTG